MKFACLPVWCTNSPGQMPHIQSAPCTSAVGHWFSQMMIVSAGRTKEATLGGGTFCPALLSAAFQVTAQLFMAYEIGIVRVGSDCQPSALSPCLGGLFVLGRP